MDLYSVDVQRKMQHLVDSFRNRFKARFGQDPITNQLDFEEAKTLVDRCGLEQARKLVFAYLSINDPWIISQGFSLKWLNSNINRVIAMTAVSTLVPSERWVVGISKSGVPVVASNQLEMGKNYFYKPMLWNEWLEAPDDQRLQYPLNKWIEWGNDEAPIWKLRWKDWSHDWRKD